MSVTFHGTIPSSGFSNGIETNVTSLYSLMPAFFGDLRAKFYSTDAANGTPGTYRATAPLNINSVWTKQ